MVVDTNCVKDISPFWGVSQDDIVDLKQISRKWVYFLE